MSGALPEAASAGQIRRARPDEADTISRLALRSKGHWGYDPEFLAACRDDLALSAADIAGTDVYVEERDGALAGYYQLVALGDDRGELNALFVEPATIGQGAGKRLWRHAVATASARECRELVIQSDPYAEGFYLAMGAERIGETESTVQPGRMLPQMRFRIPDSE